MEHDAEHGYFDDCCDEEEYYDMVKFEVVIDEVLENDKFKVLCSVSTSRKSVEELYELAMKGIPEATRIDKTWGMNVDVYFSGKELMQFVRDTYPEEAYGLKEVVEDNKLYCVCAVDLS